MRRHLPKGRWRAKFLYTPFPNTIFAWLEAKAINTTEFAVYAAIARYTWGWQKSMDSVAISQIVTTSGVSRSQTKRAIDKLKELGLIRVTQTGSRRPLIFEPLTPRWVHGGPTEAQTRVVGGPTTRSMVDHSKEIKKAQLSIVTRSE